MDTQDPRPLTVELISATTYPMPTLYYIWEQSRHDKPLPVPADIDYILNTDTEVLWQLKPSAREAVVKVMGLLGYNVGSSYAIFHGAIETFKVRFWDTIQMLLTEAVPVTENITFTFAFKNCPITLREQLVRHRVGTKIDPRVGADIIPNGPHDLAPKDSGYLHMYQVPDMNESSFWSQTSRVVPMDHFFSEGRYILPESLAGKTTTVDLGSGRSYDVNLDVMYKSCLQNIEKVYTILIAAGVPLEDARNLIPTGATHNITWNVNLKALLHILGKRTSWIAQANIWADAILQMITELSTKVHPLLGEIARPACLKWDRAANKYKYIGCPVAGTNADRIRGKDGDMPPCPLFIRYQTREAIDIANGPLRVSEGSNSQGWWPSADVSNPGCSFDSIKDWDCGSSRSRKMLNDSAARFSKLWNLDVFNPGEEITLG